MRPASINNLKLLAEFCMTFHAKFARIIPQENITEFLLAMEAPDFSSVQSGESVEILIWWVVVEIKFFDLFVFIFGSHFKQEPPPAISHNYSLWGVLIPPDMQSYCGWSFSICSVICHELIIFINVSNYRFFFVLFMTCHRLSYKEFTNNNGFALKSSLLPSPQRNQSDGWAITDDGKKTTAKTSKDIWLNSFLAPKNYLYSCLFKITQMWLAI